MQPNTPELAWSLPGPEWPATCSRDMLPYRTRANSFDSNTSWKCPVGHSFRCVVKHKLTQRILCSCIGQQNQTILCG